MRFKRQALVGWTLLTLLTSKAWAQQVDEPPPPAEPVAPGLLPPGEAQPMVMLGGDGEPFGAVPPGVSLYHLPPPERFPLLRLPIPDDAIDPATWVRFEYLNYWIKPGPLGVPLLTTGGAGQGRIGAPDTRVLMGDQTLNFGVSPGGRLTAGRWVDADQYFGIEASGFLLGRKLVTLQAASEPPGGALLAVPFIDNTSGAPHESSLVLAQPGVSSARVVSTATSFLFGAEVNGLVNLSEDYGPDNGSFQLLGGVRGIQLQEGLTFASASSMPVAGQNVHSDIFGVTSTFGGGQLGARSGWKFGRWTVDLAGKIALGVNSFQTVIAGQDNASLWYYFNRDLSGREGIFAQGTNIGRFYGRNEFSVLPELQARLGWFLTPTCRLTLGYDVLYWTNVLRPGNIIDRNLNLSQVGGPLVGPAVPSRPEAFSNFWLQGITAGVQFQY